MAGFKAGFNRSDAKPGLQTSWNCFLSPFHAYMF